jgi:hypothetical protein
MASSPTGIVFSKPRPTLGFTPENVLNTGFVPGLKSPTVAELYKEHSTSGHVPSPADQRLELERLRTIDSLVARQHKDRVESRRLLAGAALAEGLGELNVSDPQFRVKTAKLFLQFPEGADSAAAKTVAGMKNEEFSTYQKAQTTHREAVYNATLSKRIDPLLASDRVPFALKNQLIDAATGDFNANAVEKAEALHNAGGGKSGAEFYAALLKGHGLEKSDLDYVVANPSAVTYRGPLDATNPKSKYGQVSAETVLGRENFYRAVGVLPNNGTLNLPLNTFSALVATHKNLTRQEAIVAPAQADEQGFLDRQTQENSATANGVPLITARPTGYTDWLAAKPAAAPAAAATKPPVATPTPTTLQIQTRRLFGDGGNPVAPVPQE